MVARRFTATRILPLLVASAVLADVITFAECRNIQENHPYHNRLLKRAAVEDADQFQSDSATDGEDANISTPVILSDAMKIDATEGSTAQLPCKVTQGSLDDYVLVWVNGTKTILTDGDPSTPNLRYSQSQDPLSKTLTIEGVTRWDSGDYTCKITSEPPVQITHTLRVLSPIKILSLKAFGAVESTTSGGQVKKFTVKQGEPIQIICQVDGYPEPKVQWIKRMQPNTLSQGQDQSLISPQQLPSTIVSSTNELKIDYTNALHDAGHYECVAQNKLGTDAAVTAEMELIVEYRPEIIVRQPVVNTGETYTAQLLCTVHAYPKVKVTWEKEQVDENGLTSFAPLSMDNKQYEMFRPSKDNNTKSGHNYGLKVKSIQGPRDFGHYRCKAENKFGSTYSPDITLTGTPARPQQKYVRMKDEKPEIGWNVDSWSPMLGYELQFKRQQDSPGMWFNVRPHPQVINPPPGSKMGDELKYTGSYVFGEDSQQKQSRGESDFEPLSLQRGTTYVARIRGKNEHGWSDWSEDIIFSGTVLNEESNEINQNGEPEVSKANIGGASGASRVQLLQYWGATVLAIALAVVSYC